MSLPVIKHARLDREAVVQAAADLVNAEGPEALTINRLARNLHVRPPSLYNHIGGLGELRRALALLNARLLGDRLIAAVMGRSGAAGVAALAQAYRAYVKEYPGLYQASLRVSGNLSQPDPELEAAEARVVRAALAIVESFGLTGEAAIHAVRVLRSAVHGFVTLEIAGGFGIPLDLDESFRRLIDMITHGMSWNSG
ncbi:MAG: WHG domain-containing protein [Chloroflexi bacterium]|nr:WHG domain-containing protein [Chloroflexota bacterium]